jgi:putative ribosome biogenesis GTPase RsgA
MMMGGNEMDDVTAKKKLGSLADQFVGKKITSVRGEAGMGKSALILEFDTGESARFDRNGFSWVK